MKFGRNFMPLKVTMTSSHRSFNHVVSTISNANLWGGCKIFTSECGTMKICILIALQRWTTFNKPIFVKHQKYECGRWMNVKIHILLYGDNSWTSALRQMKCGTVKDHGHIYKFYRSQCFIVWQCAWLSVNHVTLLLNTDTTNYLM
jgi:hypothetical protein